MIYLFCAKSDCTDGANPRYGLLVDSIGNLYGTTDDGGSAGLGAIYQLSQVGGVWTNTVLNNICTGGFPCVDGVSPSSPLLMDAGGDLYGTMDGGGTGGTNGNSGVLYKLTSNGTNSTYSVLYNFCSQFERCSDGQSPSGQLVMDSGGNIFGATATGGAASDAGTVYEFNAAGLSSLYLFCEQAGCRDGANPYGGLIMDVSGNFYGTTSEGGKKGVGTVFRLHP